MRRELSEAELCGSISYAGDDRCESCVLGGVQACLCSMLRLGGVGTVSINHGIGYYGVGVVRVVEASIKPIFAEEVLLAELIFTVKVPIGNRFIDYVSHTDVVVVRLDGEHWSTDHDLDSGVDSMEKISLDKKAIKVLRIFVEPELSEEKLEKRVFSVVIRESRFVPI